MGEQEEKERANRIVEEVLAERGITKERLKEYLDYRDEQDKASGRTRLVNGQWTVFSDEPEVGDVDEEIESAAIEVTERLIEFAGWEAEPTT